MGKLFTEDRDLLLLQPFSSTPVNLVYSCTIFFTLVFSRCRYKEMSAKQQLADWQLDKQHHDDDVMDVPMYDPGFEQLLNDPIHSVPLHVRYHASCVSLHSTTAMLSVERTCALAGASTGAQPMAT